jgi:beta-N-acetylhexosaminidase
MVAAYIQATQRRGLMACAKHFPGHGDTASDSHLTLPVVEKDRPELERCELRPFAAAAQAGVASMMTAHVMFPAYDEHNPATMSRRILKDGLRDKLGYEGLIVSDDLEMKAVRGRFPLRQQLELACAATVDLFLVCSEPALQLECFEELVRLQEEDPAQDRLAEDALDRLDATRERFFLKAEPPPGLEVLDSPEHRALMQLIAARGMP